MKYRSHRGSLKDSMKTVIDLEDFNSLVGHLKETCSVPFRPEDVLVSKYTYDERIDWDTHMVTVSGIPVGFTDGPVEAGRTI